MKYKYNFIELRKTRNALPEDVNEQWENICRRFEDDDALRESVLWREKRWFGSITCYSKSGKKTGEAIFQNGVVHSYRIVGHRRDGMVLSEQNIINERVGFKKEVVNV